MALVIFALHTLWIMSGSYSQADLNHNPLTYVSYLGGMTGLHNQAQVSCCLAKWTFRPHYPWLLIFPISTYQVTSITGMSHLIWLCHFTLLWWTFILLIYGHRINSDYSQWVVHSNLCDQHWILPDNIF